MTSNVSWRKSSYSGGSGGNCIEVGSGQDVIVVRDTKDRPRWRKSTYSGSNGGDCTEVADYDSRVLVRDTKDRTGPVLAFSPDVWRRFTERLKNR